MTQAFVMEKVSYTDGNVCEKETNIESDNASNGRYITIFYHANNNIRNITRKMKLYLNTLQ